MNIFDIFRIKKNPTAAIAKERLQIIVAHERRQNNSPDYLPMLQQELLEVIAKYVKVKQDQVQVSFQNAGDCSILELNITLPEELQAS
jgi:cell division topological specificity factor